MQENILFLFSSMKLMNVTHYNLSQHYLLVNENIEIMNFNVPFISENLDFMISFSVSLDY